MPAAGCPAYGAAASGPEPGAPTAARQRLVAVLDDWPRVLRRPVGQTRCRMVPAGFRRTVASVTKRPVVAERLTVLPFRDEPPTRSLTVRRGWRAAVERETKRPVLALRETDRLRAMGCLLRLDYIVVIYPSLKATIPGSRAGRIASRTD